MRTIVYLVDNKGKVDSANKFIEWILEYNNEFETDEDLIKILKNISAKVNQLSNPMGLWKNSVNINFTAFYDKTKLL